MRVRLRAFFAAAVGLTACGPYAPVPSRVPSGNGWTCTGLSDPSRADTAGHCYRQGSPLCMEIPGATCSPSPTAWCFTFDTGAGELPPNVPGAYCYLTRDACEFARQHGAAGAARDVSFCGEFE